MCSVGYEVDSSASATLRNITIFSGPHRKHTHRKTHTRTHNFRLRSVRGWNDKSRGLPQLHHYKSRGNSEQECKPNLSSCVLWSFFKQFSSLHVGAPRAPSPPLAGFKGTSVAARAPFICFCKYFNLNSYLSWSPAPGNIINSTFHRWSGAAESGWFFFLAACGGEKWIGGEKQTN